jgi:hypothetical protein
LAKCLYTEGCKLIIASRRYTELDRVKEQLLGSGLRKGTVYPQFTGQSKNDTRDLWIRRCPCEQCWCQL